MRLAGDVPDYTGKLVIKMKTIVAKADLENEELFRKASDILKSGGLVAFPTETVYGLGGDALNPKASEKFTVPREDHRIIR